MVLVSAHGPTIQGGVVADFFWFNALDWEGSCISSDPLDCQPDLGVQQIGEPDDANAI